jgi:hypothetical protein
MTMMILGSGTRLLAQTPVPPILTISDNQGNSITIDSTGNATCTGTVDCTGTTDTIIGSPGTVGFIGNVGQFSIGTAVGTVNPAGNATSSTQIDIFNSSVANNGSTAGTLTVSFTANNFVVGANSTAKMSVTPSFTTTGTAVYTSYTDGTNAPFGTGTPVNTITEQGSGTAIASGPTTTMTPYSMTSTVSYTIPAGGTLNNDDFNLIIPPSPLTLSCPVNSATAGVPYSATLMAHGGVPPYAYSLSNGPAWLSLGGPNGNVLSGTPPNATTTYNFTIGVTDSSGNTATNTVTQQCSITVTVPPSPLSLACPASTGQVGFPYSSMLTAMGGVFPYKFSIISGHLPGGLTLSASGAISGIPTSEGSFPVTFKVTDSSGISATNSATSQCTITTNTCGTKLQPANKNVDESHGQGEIVWFNSHLQALSGNIPTSTFSLYITNNQITFGNMTLTAPDAVITYSSSVTCGTTSYNAMFNRWETTLPLSYATKADEVFASGLAYLLPQNFSQNANVVWTADISSSAPGVTADWQFSASNWLTSNKGTYFPGFSASSSTPDYNAMMVNPVHNAPVCNPSYAQGDHAGAPEFAGRGNVLTGGGAGGGGSNWTGSWSNTPGSTPVCKPQGPPQLSIQCPPSTGIVGVPYQGGFTASGGTPAYSFSLTPGSSLGTLSLSQTSGAITGIVQSPTTLTFGGQVTDSSNPPMTATTGANACTITFSNQPQQSCPASAASSPLINSLGEASPANFAVLSLGGSGGGVNINCGTVVGNVGVPNSQTMQESGPSSVTGTIYLGSQVSSANVKGKYSNLVIGADALLNQAASDAMNASSEFASLSPTLSSFPTNVTSNVTVNLQPGRNVVSIPSFMLNGGTLTFNGPAGSSLVINDSGNFQMQKGNMAVTGGIGPLDIVWNITSSSASVQTMVPTTGVGIILAPTAAINAMDSSTFTGEVIGSYSKQITIMSCTTVSNPCAH